MGCCICKNKKTKDSLKNFKLLEKKSNIKIGNYVQNEVITIESNRDIFKKSEIVGPTKTVVHVFNCNYEAVFISVNNVMLSPHSLPSITFTINEDFESIPSFRIDGSNEFPGYHSGIEGEVVLSKRNISSNGNVVGYYITKIPIDKKTMLYKLTLVVFYKEKK